VQRQLSLPCIVVHLCGCSERIQGVPHVQQVWLDAPSGACWSPQQAVERQPAAAVLHVLTHCTAAGDTMQPSGVLHLELLSFVTQAMGLELALLPGVLLCSSLVLLMRHTGLVLWARGGGCNEDQGPQAASCGQHAHVFCAYPDVRQHLSQRALQQQWTCNLVAGATCWCASLHLLPYRPCIATKQYSVTARLPSQSYRKVKVVVCWQADHHVVGCQAGCVQQHSHEQRVSADARYV
jgi:hypothetical protein